MCQLIRIYLLLRSQGHTRHGAIREIYRWLDDLLTLYVGLQVQEQNVRGTDHKEHKRNHMGMLNFFKGRELVVVDPDARSFVVAPDRPFINLPAIGAAGLRRGQWVVCADGVGILTGARLDGMGEVTLQKDDGYTRMELDANDKAVPAVRVVDMSTLRAARIEEIAAWRHEGDDHVRSLGYISTSEA